MLLLHRSRPRPQLHWHGPHGLLRLRLVGGVMLLLRRLGVLLSWERRKGRRRLLLRLRLRLRSQVRWLLLLRGSQHGGAGLVRLYQVLSRRGLAWIGSLRIQLGAGQCRLLHGVSVQRLLLGRGCGLLQLRCGVWCVVLVLLGLLQLLGGVWVILAARGRTDSHSTRWSLQLLLLLRRHVGILLCLLLQMLLLLLQLRLLLLHR